MLDDDLHGTAVPHSNRYTWTSLWPGDRNHLADDQCVYARADPETRQKLLSCELPLDVCQDFVELIQGEKGKVFVANAAHRTRDCPIAKLYGGARPPLLFVAPCCSRHMLTLVDRDCGLHERGARR